VEVIGIGVAITVISALILALGRASWHNRLGGPYGGTYWSSSPGVDRRLHELVGRARRGQVAAVDDRVACDLGGGLLRDVGIEVVDQDARAVL